MQSTKATTPRPKNCEECIFKTETVTTFGNPDADIVFIGESPGALELHQNNPLTGPAKQVLKTAFNGRLTEDDYYYINAIQCFPKKRKDADETNLLMLAAGQSCRSELIKKLTSCHRKVIVTLGNPALWAITNHSGYKITKERGKVFPTDFAEYLIPSVHPTFLLRGGGSWHKFCDDIQYAIDLAKGGRPRKFIEPAWAVWDASNARERLRKLTKYIRESNEPVVLASDAETSGLHHIKDYPINMGVCYKASMVEIIPREFIPMIAPLFKSKKVKWTWHNGKFDVKFIRNHFNINARVDEDTMLLNYSLDEMRGHHDLDQVASDLLSAPNHKQMLDEYLPNKKSSYTLIPIRVLEEYLAYDVSKTFQIFQVLKKRNEEDARSRELYNDLLIPAAECLSRIEMRGVYIDDAQVAENFEYYVGSQDPKGKGGLKGKLQQDLNDLALSYGYLEGVNANSPPQMNKFLYGFLKLGSTELDTSKDTLEKLPPHDAVKKILEIRRASKAFGTYVKPYRNLVTEQRRIHTTFGLHSTATGRLGSSDPNIQNVPRLPRLRGQIIATPGYILLDKDYDQAELRVLACLSEDPELLRIYTSNDLSLHVEVSVELWGPEWKVIYKDPEHEAAKSKEWQECKEQYMRTKALNFGIIYGRTAISIALEFDISVKEAQAMIDVWANKYKEAWAFIENCRLAPVRGQNLITAFGNRKRTQLVSRDALQSLMNEAANFPHQGNASHCTLMSAVRLQPILEERGVHIINLIHDDILTELPDNDPELLAWADKTIDEVMQQVPIDYGLTEVPFLTDGSTGYRWGS